MAEPLDLTAGFPTSHSCDHEWMLDTATGVHRCPHCECFAPHEFQSQTPGGSVCICGDMSMTHD